MQNKLGIRSLKAKIMMMMAVLVTIPLAILGIVSATNSHNAMEESVMQQLDELAISTAENIEMQIQSLDLVIASLTENPYVQQAASGDLSAKSKAQEVLINKKGQTGDLIQGLYVTSATTAFMSDGSLELNLDLSEREYLNTALTGTNSASSVIQSKDTGTSVIAVAHPVYAEGQIVGAVIAAADFDVLSAKIADIKVFDGGYGYIFDETGLCLYHPKEEYKMNLNLADLEIPELDAMVKTIQDNQGGEQFYTFEGIYKYVRYEVVNGWGIAVTANYNDYMAAALKIRNVTAVITVSAILFSLALIYLFINKSILKPIKNLNMLMNAAGDGDLTVRAQIATGDEIQELGDQFNTMIARQEDIVENVRQGSNQLSKTSDTVSRSSMEVSSATEEIAASITEVAHHTDQQNNDVVEASQIMLQFSTLIELAKKTALEAQTSMSRSLEAAETGRTFVDHNQKAIVNIQQTSQETSHVLGELSSLSKQVGGIVESINDISSQTNMLALNAAIESARAGVHGKGFAVVADQVRMLAEQAADEAEKIHVVIERMVAMIDDASRSMAQGQAAVDEGVTISGQTDEAFVHILSEVKTTMEKILHIVDVTEEEVASSEKIINVIDKVATLTEKTALNAQSVAAGAEEQASVVTEVAESTVTMQKMATTLDELVNRFRTRGEAHV